MNCSRERKCMLFCYSFILLFGIMCTSELTIPKKIAIIGGGIGGTSCAKFLNELLGSNKSIIHLYERNRIGGRLKVMTVNDRLVETGGSVIHPRNRYMLEFSHIFGLKRREALTTDQLGLYDGTSFKFVESRHWIINLFKLGYRYGISIFKIKRYISDLLNKFDRIYTAQKNHQCFKTVKELLSSMDEDFPLYLNRTIKDGLINFQRCNEVTVNELVSGANMVNYGQNNEIHQFVGSVSIAGAEDGLWAVEGGNYLVAEHLLSKSGAELIRSTVERVELLEKNFKVSTASSSELYDIVILATPIVENIQPPIKFVNFTMPISVSGTYHQTVATFVVGVINYDYFGYSKVEDVPGHIFSINDGNFFNSVSLLVHDAPHSIYKVFSKLPLNDYQLGLLFRVRHFVKIENWLAYPNYSSINRDDSFVLFKNMYYINAIEWAASAMEMSVIGAKNVALLVYNDYKSNSPKQRLRRKDRTEL